jgi:hypothetical protein
VGSTTDDTVSGIMEKWATGFNKLDDGVAAYFDALPRWRSPTVQFTDVRTAPVGSELINVAGTASFFLDEGAPPLSVKITWVIVREDDDWKIVSHHVSSKTPLIEQ